MYFNCTYVYSRFVSRNLTPSVVRRRRHNDVIRHRHRSYSNIDCFFFFCDRYYRARARRRRSLLLSCGLPPSTTMSSNQSMGRGHLGKRVELSSSYTFTTGCGTYLVTPGACVRNTLLRDVNGRNLLFKSPSSATCLPLLHVLILFLPNKCSSTPLVQLRFYFHYPRGPLFLLETGFTS